MLAAVGQEVNREKLKTVLYKWERGGGGGYIYIHIYTLLVQQPFCLIVVPVVFV